ncbi:MAG: glycoside hydrolase family 2 TIM barrel-domain containing protein [Acidobacteriota bacterium]
MKISRSLLAIFLSLLLLNLVSPSGEARAQGRTTSNFDSDWLFFKGDAEGAEKPGFVDADWRKLNVPHDWSIEGPFDAKNPTGGAGGFLPSGVGWYRKHFTVGANKGKRRFFIEFDGVMANSDVWLNGVHICRRPYGYVSFGEELTDQIKLGQDNVIAVRADTSAQPASRWYTGAGIYRHVRLIETDLSYIEKWATFVSTPSIAANEATVQISTTFWNLGTKRTVSFEISLIDGAGKTVATAKVPGSLIIAGDELAIKKDIKIKIPKLWTLESPKMYRAEIKVIENGKVIDTDNVPFGIREFHFDPNTGFWLNGKNFKIKGACLHVDGSAFGAAVPLAVWERRLNELRKLGVNAIRTAHDPPAPEFLDLADRMGFLVMEELFDQWTLGKNPFDNHLYFAEWAKADVRDTVRRDRNHPSIIIYSAGNEIRDNHADQEKAKQTLQGLVNTFHENDPTRPVTQALFRPNIEGANDYNNGLAEIWP